ncbi:hypothetical protein AAK964_10175 [Tissierella praeacuta]|uniref:hypothetical protein n=1 Tax=Tissierella praeacuta TaxID=43131 RepID=UPI0035149200
MAYNTKPIKRDKDNNPIAQYYDPSKDNYIPLEGSDGANHVKILNSDNSPVDINLDPILDKLNQLTGTVIDEQTRKSNEIIRQQLYDEIKYKLENGELQGKVGPQGEQGKGVNILGKYDTLNELAVAHPDGSELNGGFLVDGHYYYWGGTKWEDAGLIQGPKGDPGQVQSVNDKVGDVYLTGEDIRVHQNQPWPISHALNSLDKRTEYIPYATDAPVKLGGGEKCRTLISTETETEEEKVFELSAHCSNWVLKFKSRILIELPDLNLFRWGTNEIKGDEDKWFTMRVLCFNQGSIPVQLETELSPGSSGLVFWDGRNIAPSIQGGTTALVEYVGTYYRFEDSVVWLAKIIWQD